MVVNHEKLKKVLVEIALGAGANAYEAEILADSIVDAELRGMSSHGLVRYPAYMNRIKQGETVAMIHTGGIPGIYTRHHRLEMEKELMEYIHII